MIRLMARLWVSLLLIAYATPILLAAAGELPVRLEDFVAQALVGNLDLQAAEHRLHSVRVQATEAGLLDDPAFMVRRETPASNLFSTDELWLGLSRTFPGAGKRAWARLAAQIEIDMEVVAVEEVRRRVITTARAAWLDLVAADAIASIQQEQIALARAMLDVAQNQFAAGAGDQQGVLRAQIDLLERTNDLATTQQERKGVEARVNTLMKRSPESLGGSSLGAPEMPVIAEITASLAELQEMADATAVQAARLAIEHHANQIEAAALARRPDFSVEAGLMYMADAPDLTMLSLSIPLPWANRARYTAQRDAARILKMHAESAYQAAQAATRLAIGERHIEWEAARRTFRLYDVALLPILRQGVEVATNGNATGTLDRAAVIAAQAELHEAQRTRLRALISANKAADALSEIVGHSVVGN